MNFDFFEDQKFIQKTARDYLAEHADLGVCRAVLESDQRYDRNLWKGVAEMGWLGAVVPESYGGAGMGHLELVLIAQEIGRALAPIPFSSSVYLVTEALLRLGSEGRVLRGGSEEQRKSYLPRLCAGDLVGAFAVAEGTGEFEPASPETRLEKGKLRAAKLPGSGGQGAGPAPPASGSGAGAGPSGAARGGVSRWSPRGRGADRAWRSSSSAGRASRRARCAPSI